MSVSTVIQEETQPVVVILTNPSLPTGSSSFVDRDPTSLLPLPVHHQQHSHVPSEQPHGHDTEGRGRTGDASVSRMSKRPWPLCDWMRIVVCLWVRGPPVVVVRLDRSFLAGTQHRRRCALARQKGERGSLLCRRPDDQDEGSCGATVRRDDQTNPGSKPIKTTTDLSGNILCLELNQLSSQYLKTNIHQSLSLVSGRLPDLHRPSASDFVFLLSSSHPTEIRRFRPPGFRVA